MYATTNRLSMWTLLLSIVTVFMSALLLVYISSADINYYMSLALSALVVCLAAFTLLTTIALRSLRQELSWEFEDNVVTIKELKERIRVLEEKVANN